MHARRVDLRARPDGLRRDRVGDRPARACSRKEQRERRPALIAPRRMVELEVDGQPVRCSRARRSSMPAAQSASICRRSATARRSQPANVCRVCVVEVEGVPGAGACLLAEGRGRDGGADRFRTRAARASSCSSSSRRRSTCRRRPWRRRTWNATSAARALWPTGSAGSGRVTASAPATMSSRTARRRRPSTQPVKIDNELYVRDYSKCILCYKCVDACGEQFQNTFAIARRRPRFRRAHLDRVRRRRCPSRRACTAATASPSVRPAR